MPVYNGRQFLRPAIESVLTQTHSDFEFLIINDGSDDDSVEIIQSFTDPRVHLVHNPQNLGIAESLNRGLTTARGLYVVRMDCDDICAPRRLETLFKFMQQHPEVGVCGSFLRTIDGDNQLWKLPCDDRTIRCRMLFESCIPHPSAIIRMEVINRFHLRYDANYERAEDYDFWSRCSAHTQLANYPQALLEYRVHARQIGSLYPEPQQQVADLVRKRELGNLGVVATEQMLFIHRSLSTWNFDSDQAFLSQAAEWLNLLSRANDNTRYLPEPEFGQELASRLYRACYTSPHGRTAWQTYADSPFSGRPNTSRIDSIKLFLRCIVNHATQ